MRWNVPVWIVLAIALVTTPSVQAIGGPDSMRVPNAKSGDVGLLELTRAQVAGEDAAPNDAPLSMAFEVQNRTSMSDAYGEERTVFPVELTFVNESGPQFGYTSSVDRLGQGPIALNLSAQDGISSQASPRAPLGSSVNVQGNYSWLASRTQSFNTTSCALFPAYQGTTLETEENLASQPVCGEDLDHRARDLGGSAEVRVAEVLETESGRTLSRIHVTLDVPGIELSADVWQRSDLPYPLETTVEGHLEDETGDPLELVPEKLGSLTAWLVGPSLLSPEPLRQSLEDGEASFQTQVQLTRFGRGQGEALDERGERDWAQVHPSADFEPVTRWGPADGGPTFAYSLGEAVESIREDPTLGEYHDWLNSHPDARLVNAVLSTDDTNGPETQQWRLLFVAPDGSGYAVSSERPTGAEIGDERLEAEAPASDNEAHELRDLEIPYPGPVDERSITIASAIDIWHEETRTGNAGEQADGFEWSVDRNGSSASVQHEDADQLRRSPTGVRSAMETRGIGLDADEGSLRWIQEGSSENEVGYTGTEGRDTGWAGSAPATGSSVQSPSAATLAGTSAIAILLALLAKTGLLPFYSRLADDELLENDTRREVYETVGQSPGLSLSELAEASGHARSTVRYHLRRLESRGLVTSVKGPDARRFFRADAGQPEQLRRQAVLATGRTREIFEAIEANPGASLSEVCEATGLAPSSAHRIVGRLVDEGLVAKRQDGRSVELTPNDA